MKHTHNVQQQKSQSVANMLTTTKPDATGQHFADHRPEGILQRRLQQKKTVQSERLPESSPLQARWINNGHILMWEALVEGAQWFYEPDTTLMYYFRDGESSEKKPREVWVKEYGSDPLAQEDASVTAGMTGNQVHGKEMGPAGDLMGQFNARYFTKVYWESKSGPDEELGKTVIIESYVRKDDGGMESVYKNEMDVRNNAFYAAYNQRETDTKVGTKKSVAMFNSDLITCHRHLAMEFGRRQGVEMTGDGSSFLIVRKNVNNGDWQQIYTGLLPIKARAALSNAIVTSDNPIPLGKTIEYKSKQASSVLEVLQIMIPNSKAVYQMIKDRYQGYYIAGWQYKGGCLIATVRRS